MQQDSSHSKPVVFEKTGQSEKLNLSSWCFICLDWVCPIICPVPIHTQMCHHCQNIGQILSSLLSFCTISILSSKTPDTRISLTLFIRKRLENMWLVNMGTLVVCVSNSNDGLSNNRRTYGFLRHLFRIISCIFLCADDAIYVSSNYHYM